MDPFTTTIPGSRYPITVPVMPPSSHRTPKTHSSSSKSPPMPEPISKIRRKPKRTYQSPSLHHQVGLRIEDGQHTSGTNKLEQHSIFNHATTSAVRESPYTAPCRTIRAAPPLPLYHPLGPLALSLPELDPSIFGLPNPVSLDDNDVTMHDNDLTRRSSSRARRPAAKLRDRDRDQGDEEDKLHQTNGSSSATTAQLGSRVIQEKEPRTASPRKRRTGGGGGSRRKRKEPDDGDGTYPQPAKRTRNPRGGAAAVIPLADAAAPDAVDMGASTVPDAADVEEPQVDTQPAPESSKPTTRSRKPRAANAKRRNSSASDATSTSVSVSIAMNPRITRATSAKTEEAQKTDAGSVPGPIVEKNEEEEPEPEPEAEMETEAANPQALVGAPPSGGEASGEGPEQAVAAEQREIIQAPVESGAAERMVVDEVEVNVGDAAAEPRHELQNRNEEKEEGELSEEADGDGAKKP